MQPSHRPQGIIYLKRSTKRVWYSRAPRLNPLEAENASVKESFALIREGEARLV